MNHTRTHKTVRSLLVWLLLLTMVFGLLPMAAFADEAVVEPVVSEEPVQELEPSSEPTEAPSEPTQEPTQEPESEQPGNADVTIEGDEEQPEDEDMLETASLTATEYVAPPAYTIDPSNPIRVYHIDCGRKYFSAAQINAIIDKLAEYGYTHIELAFGNEGLRFLLNDMSVNANGTIYDGSIIKSAIQSFNASFDNSSENLSETDMDSIFSHAAEKGIKIIPLLNSPGHMDAILSAMEAVGMKNVKYKNSNRTVDITNVEAVNFTMALVKKYVEYFAGKNCQFFNIGTDEYANDVTSGFADLITARKYGDFVTYVNNLDNIVKSQGMLTIAFNDGIYYNNTTNDGTFYNDIIISYWTSGWFGYSPASPDFLINRGHKILNTNDAWYYVLGRRSGNYPLSNAQNGVNKKAYNVLTNGSTINGNSLVGCMMCLWCDDPKASYNDSELNTISDLLSTFAQNNSTVFKTTTPGGGESGGSGETGDGVINLTVGQTSREIATTADVGAQTTNNANIATASVTKGTATEKTLKEITDASELSADKQYLIVNIRKGAVLTATPSNWEDNNCLALNGAPTVNSTDLWKIEPSGSYYTIQDIASSNYLNIGENTASVGNSAKLTLSYNTNTTNAQAGWNISYEQMVPNWLGGTTTYKYYLNNLGDTAKAGGWKYTYNNNAANDAGSKWRIYEIAETTAASSSNVLTFTGTGEGTTTANIGDVEYTIKVTAREKTENKTLNFGESFTLLDGAVVEKIEGDAVHQDGSSIVAGDTVGNAVVTAVVKNAGGKVTDRYTYNINVTDKAPDGSMTGGTLSLEYWITNFMVYDGKSTNTNHTKSITSAQAAGTEGIEIKTIAPDPAYSFFDGTKTVYYWQAMRLDSAHKQTGESGVDRTAVGTTLTNVRYNDNGAWQYKTADGAWHYFQSDDQLVAYYLQKTDVTKEITTFTKDWGYGTSSTTPDTSDGKGQVALSVAVVYPDGQLSPIEDKIYSQSTTIFNFWDNRDIGIVAPVNNSDYNISKITVTDGTRTSNTTDNQWYKSDSITWQKETTASGGQWYKETEVWKKSDGTTPMVNGAASNIRWSEKNTAKLILIYLEPVEKDTNLEIVYYDDTAKREIKSYQVSMTYTGQTVPTFDTALMQGDQVIGGTKNWPGKTASDPYYLPNDAYVLNSANFKETFNKNLTELPGIADNYKSGIYEYNGANISKDGKTLTLHYQVKAFENSKTIVVDFGLPVEVTGLLDWFGVTDSSTVKDISLATGTALYDSVGSYGRAVINTETWNSLTYTLQKLIDAEITIPLHLNFKSGGQQQQRQLKVIPATNVYYEDSFVGEGFKNGTGAAASAVWSIDRDDSNIDAANVKQALSVLGSKDIYGNDEAYNNSSKFSMGSAKTVTVNSGMLNGWDDTSAWPTATFTFKGTGFDIISLTNNQSGAIIVTVYKNGNAVKNLLVNNYYGYTKNKNGEWVVNNDVNNAANCLYQIPVIQVRGLDYGEYTAEVKVFYNDAFNQTAGSSYSFWFDGFRVYDPMGKDNSIYTKDEEGYPQYIKLRDEIAKPNATATVKTTLFIDGAAEANVAEYKNYGPNNEVYLAKDQAISFRLADNANIATIQIGAKSPNAGETKVAKMQLDSTTEIATATEMYYDITAQAKGKQVTITNTGDAILSLTNIKITYSEKSTTELAALSEGDEQAAVAAVRALYAAPVVEPVEPFKPEHFEAKWSNNVRQGGRAVLTVKTSADVEQIIINGDIVVSNYKTRTERVGYGRNAERVTYHVFTYMISAQQSAEYSVVAVNDTGLMSEAVTARLTVRPKGPIKDWFDGLFGGWF